MSRAAADESEGYSHFSMLTLDYSLLSHCLCRRGAARGWRILSGRVVRTEPRGSRGIAQR